MEPHKLLGVRDLSVRFATEAGPVLAVDRVSFDIARGETLALVGESGSGKSTAALSLMGLLGAAGGATLSGRIDLRLKNGSTHDINRLSARELRRVRGNEMAMIFQDPMSSLNPVYTIESQICEAIILHQKTAWPAARRRALELLHSLGIPNPEKCMTSFPHQLSGGMRQRVMIAVALSCEPRLLIADEPTTALDVTIQAQIIELLKRVQSWTGMAILFITHNLGLVAELGGRVIVMYAGRVVEQGKVAEVFSHPCMPYTQALLRSLPRLRRARAPRQRLQAIPGNVPSAVDRPAGCAFHPRCGFAAKGMCDTRLPALEDCGGGHLAACLRWRDIASGKAA
ncbi:MAG: ABC transporter ATP-binding protein [Proteobacteria bacterium]|nr:ABC transporter ATP-binding protein [Pseudomonadota bacterium]